MRFPTATWSQVREVVAQQLAVIPNARRRALIAVVFYRRSSGQCHHPDPAWQNC